uniref:Uncharacterized protein n=1 Tax=Arundo donax TaxID=35708 RepID=A0A0A9FPQ4_ARUDO
MKHSISKADPRFRKLYTWAEIGGKLRCRRRRGLLEHGFVRQRWRC